MGDRLLVLRVSIAEMELAKELRRKNTAWVSR